MSYPTSAGFKTKGTSEAAAESMQKAAPLLRDRILAHLKQCGYAGSTPDACADALGETVLAVRPRFTELKHAGKIRETALTEKNASGRSANVYLHADLYGGATKTEQHPLKHENHGGCFPRDGDGSFWLTGSDLA